MKIDKRVERNTQSLLALESYLNCIVNNPSEFLADMVLRDALRSQGALSKFSDGGRGIVGSSLNTIKRIAEGAIAGGFEALDRLRNAACDAIAIEEAKRHQSNKATKVGLIKRVKELEAFNQQLRQDLFLITMLFEKSLKQGYSYASKTDTPAIVALCKREQRELMDMFSLRKHTAVGRSNDDRDS
jgi:hypothetical protein